MSFFIGNQEKFQTNLSVHDINARYKHQFPRQAANLSCFQKGASYCGIRTAYHEVLQILTHSLPVI